VNVRCNQELSYASKVLARAVHDVSVNSANFLAFKVFGSDSGARKRGARCEVRGPSFLVRFRLEVRDGLSGFCAISRILGSCE
jgi:hypothetical protein